MPPALLLVFALLLAAWSTTPPAAISAAAPATSFSAARAMATVRLVGREPHPAGSPEVAALRGALAQRMRALGLSVTPLRAVGASVSSRPGSQSAAAGRVETLIGVLPGEDRTLPAIAIMAHLDSVEDSPGAADDGAGLAVALEVARAIAAGKRPSRDVMLILTDGEEAGLLGAYAFFADPARAARVGAIVNLDSRGTSGLGMMFETGPGSGGLVALYRARATHRSAQSAATFLYRLLPNRTDLTAAMDRGIPALNFAFLDGEFDYHTARDSIATLDPRTLQSLGDQILPVVRGVAESRALPPRGPDGVFGDADGILNLGYPAWVGWPLLAAALALAAVGARGANLGGAVRAAMVLVGIGLTAALAARFGYGLTGVGEDWADHHRITAHFGRYEAGLALAALACVLAGATALRNGFSRWRVALGFLAASILAVLLGRAILPTAVLALAGCMAFVLAPKRVVGEREATAGALAVGLLLSGGLQVAAPALTPLLLWPTLAAALGAAAARWLPAASWWRAAIGLLPLAYTFVFAHAVLLALGVPTPEAVGLFALVTALLILPLIAHDVRWPAIGTAAAAAILLLSFRWSDYTERHPALSQVYGVRDANGRSWRVSPLERPDAWTRAALRHDGGTISKARMPIVAKGPLWRAPAHAIAVAPPEITVARQGAATAVTIRPAADSREMRLLVDVDRPMTNVTIEGVPLPGFAARPGVWHLRWQSPGESVTLGFNLAPGTRIAVTAAETSQRKIPVAPRPKNVVPWLGSDRTIAISRAAWRD